MQEMKSREFAHSRSLLILLILMVLPPSCAFPNPNQLTPLPATTGTAVGSDSSWLQVYFTDPAGPRADNYEGGPDEILAAAIDQARLSVDVAAYSFNLWSIRDALIHAHQRGLVVRMVMESDNIDDREVQQIKDSGIPVVGDQHESLMHNKFVVLDRLDVWTGSMNFTVGAAYKDNNNLIHLRSTEIAQDYTTEFEEMFTHHLFGSDAMADTPYPKQTINATPVEIYFSPDDKVAKRILEILNATQSSINFMAYTITSNEIGNAIIQRAQAGIPVSGVMDENQVITGQGSEYDLFMQSGLNVRLDGNPNGLMHHKVFIIDGKIVITGSYNFTASAEEENDENVVIIFSPEVAKKYLEEFQRIYTQTQMPETVEPDVTP
jgi:phosphatidylserine/phosphatidylglycerophosphate/cardiolipin synthase-like enzyme